MRLPVISAFLLILYPQSLLAWWDTGHEIIAQIALSELSQKTLNRTHELLGFPLKTPGSKALSQATSDLATASIWADIVKISPLFQESFKSDPYGAECHFLNVSFTQAEASGFFPIDKHGAVQISKNSKENKLIRERITQEARDPGQNLLTCLKKVTVLVKEKSVTLAEKALALRYLIHLIGDIHQPLHNFSVDSDQGGNKAKIDPVEIKTFSALHDKPSSFVNNLHFFWDALLGLYPQLTMVKFFNPSEVSSGAFNGHSDYTLSVGYELMDAKDYKVLQKQVRSETPFGYEDWSFESIQLGMAVAYANKDLNAEEGVKSYRNYFLRRQLRIAGLRLGQTLNALFD